MNETPCPKIGMVGPLIASIPEIHLAVLFIEAHKDELATEKIKSLFHPKNTLYTAISKITLNIAKHAYLDNILPDLMENLTLLENAARYDKLRLFLQNEKTRTILLKALDGLITALNAIQHIRETTLKHCKEV